MYRHADLTIKDIIPFSLTRIYRQGDYLSRAFGIGMSQTADMYLIGDFHSYQYIDLIDGDGSRTHFTRTSPGTNFVAVYMNTTNGNCFYRATLTFNVWAWGWEIRETNGTVLSFPEADGQTNPEKAALDRITDRNGSITSLARDPSSGVLTKVTTPNGRWIAFSHDSENRIIQAMDNIGRKVLYTYDEGGRLASVTDPLGNVTQYAYDVNDEMASITDARGNLVVSNAYDDDGRISTQTPRRWRPVQFAYTLDGNGNIVQATVTDPLNDVESMTYGTNGYFTSGNILTDTRASGTALAQTSSYSWDPATNLLLSTTNALGRTTSYAYL